MNTIDLKIKSYSSTLDERGLSHQTNESMSYQNLDQLLKEQRTEIEILQQKLQVANQVKHHFLNNMRHEMLTPLHAINGFAYLLKNHLQNSEHTEYLEKIESASQRLLSLINDVLDLSKIESHQLALVQDTFILEDILSPIIEATSSRIREKDLDIQIKLLGIVANQGLQGDLRRLRQIIYNYVDNAIKFTHKGGIIITVSFLGENQNGMLLKFEVQDSGIGVAADLIPDLFSLFNQGDNSSTRQYSGIGAGLALNKSLAKIMGGSLGLESVLGQGSIFWFTIRLLYW